MTNNRRLPGYPGNTTSSIRSVLSEFPLDCACWRSTRSGAGSDSSPNRENLWWVKRSITLLWSKEKRDKDGNRRDAIYLETDRSPVDIVNSHFQPRTYSSLTEPHESTMVPPGWPSSPTQINPSASSGFACRFTNQSRTTLNRSGLRISCSMDQITASNILTSYN